MSAGGYSPQGRAARASLTEADVRRIRQLGAEGVPTRKLADTYSMTPEAIRRILRWETWRWVSEEGAGFEARALPPDQAALLEEFMKPKPQLAGQLNPNGIQSTIPNESGKPTDGGTGT